MSEKIFAEGIYWKEKHANAPSFILGEVSFKVEDAIKFLKQYKNDKGYANLTLKVGKSGKRYLELNTYGLKTNESSITPEQVQQIQKLKEQHNSEQEAFDMVDYPQDLGDMSNVPF